jgi:hypothetical protein
MAFTITTSTWADGSPGPICCQFSPGTVPNAFLKEFNKKWQGQVLLLESRTDSHFFNAESTLKYWHDLLTFAFRRKRHELGCSDATTSPGLLVADAFAGTTASAHVHV